MSRTAPALLLSLVYAAALAAALTDLGQHAVAGLLVLGGLTARLFLRSRRAAPGRPLVRSAVAEPIVGALGADAVAAPARAA